jgi:bacterial leucyl aminopeptidase
MKMKSSLLMLMLSMGVFAQDKSEFIYASLEAQHASELKASHPELIDIITTHKDVTIAHLHPEAAHELHQKILSHGPGYLMHPSKEAALNKIKNVKEQSRTVLQFTIDQQPYVRQVLNDVSQENIEEVMLALEGFGTRYHTSAQANQSAEYVKQTWESIIAQYGRQNDVSVRLVNHNNTPMKSVVVTINGNRTPNEYVIIGGHLDSTVGGWDKSVAPGSDDDASGIATITEALRVLLANDFQPNRTVEIMAYAAEEIGLVGSNEIATSYRNQNKNVVAYVQFDMTNFKGSSQDVYLATDSFINNSLNLYLIELIEEYNSSGDHQMTYGTTRCNYGCSDHYSWAVNNYPAAFPFEASFNDSNMNIHTPYDTFELIGDASHSVKFAKLALEFLVETAKHTGSLATANLNATKGQFYLNKKTLGFELPTEIKVVSATVINVSGQKLITKSQMQSKDSLDLNHLPQGGYILVLETQEGKKISHKFILK